MNREKVIVILRYYRDADKAIKMNERVIKNLEDQYYSTLRGGQFRRHAARERYDFKSR